ncbi:hypothetical protein AAC387_Pa03g1117 [Persea americana]
MKIKNCYFPLFVSLSVLQREKDHIEGFAPEFSYGPPFLAYVCDPLRKFSVVEYPPDDTASEFRVAETFKNWREKHGKVYKHLEEKERRFENFRRNLAYVIERNTNGGTMGHKVGLNTLADLSNEEFREVYLS